MDRVALLLLMFVSALLVSVAPAAAFEGNETELLPGPAQTSPKTSDPARELGRVLPAIEAGKLLDAQGSLQAAQKLQILSDYLDLFQIMLWIAQEDLDEAIALGKKAEKKRKDSLLRWAYADLQGDAFQAKGDETRAREEWRRALQYRLSKDKKAKLWFKIGESHERSQELPEALFAYREADGRYPATSGGRESTGRIELLAPQLEQGVRSAAVASVRADHFYAKGHTEEARQGYEEAMRGNLSAKQKNHATLQLGHSLFRLRKYPEAVKVFDSLAPSSQALYWRARSYARSGEVTRAINEFEELGETASSAIRASQSLFLAGVLLEGRGETERALAHYRNASNNRRAPEQARVGLWRAGWLLFQEEQYHEALGLFQQLVKLETHPIDGLRPRYWAARCSEELGDEETAQAAFVLLATEYPFTYYGWRSAGRAKLPPIRSADENEKIPSGRSALKGAEIERLSLLLDADLKSWAQDELENIFRRARSLEDRLVLAKLFTHAGDFHHAQRLIVDAYTVELAKGERQDYEELWQLAWPTAYVDLVEDEFPKDAAIDHELVWSIMREESSFRPEVVSSAGAYGLLQIMPETGERLAQAVGLEEFNADDLFSPRVNIKLGATYLDQLAKRFPDRPSAAIGGYNAGPNAIADWLKKEGSLEDDVWVEKIPYSQTQAYVKRVLRSLHVYRTLY